jgi:hypothetical protein
VYISFGANRGRSGVRNDEMMPLRKIENAVNVWQSKYMVGRSVQTFDRFDDGVRGSAEQRLLLHPSSDMI